MTARRWPVGTSRRRRRGVRRAASAAPALVVVLVVLTGGFLLWKAVPALLDNEANFLTDRVWQPAGDPPQFGIAALLWTTVLASVLALLLAVPVAIGVALFITQYAPRRLARPVAYVVDLLAAIPSIIYGLWGIRCSARSSPAGLRCPQVPRGHPRLVPLFAGRGSRRAPSSSAAIVLAIMILPIITAISREVFDQTPRPNKEAALALGATRWEMIRDGGAAVRASPASSARRCSVWAARSARRSRSPSS